MDTLPIFVDGYTDRVSYVAGELISLHVSCSTPTFSIEVARVGEKRKVVLKQEDITGGVYGVPEDASSHGCRWPSAFQLTVPQDWVGGYYEILLTVTDEGGTFTHRNERQAYSVAYFILRSDVSVSNSSILLQLSTNTYAAYNNWGGYSLYAYHGRGGVQGHRVSFDRPDRGLYSRWEKPFVSWAERSGYELDYCSNLDLEQHPEILGGYALVLSVGHDEYWSAPMRDHLEKYIEHGGNAAFLSGNSVCWQVRSEDKGRALTCWKQRFNQDPAFRDDRSKLSTLWSHHLLERPENILTGVGFLHGGYHLSHGQYMEESGAYTVHRPKNWVFSGTKLEYGDSFGGGNTIVGYECDGCEIDWQDGLPYPTGRDGTPTDFEILGTAPARWHPDDCEWYDAWQPGHEGNAVMGLYKRGGTVFTAGTTDWSHGLTGGDIVTEMITENVLNKLSGID